MKSVAITDNQMPDHIKFLQVSTPLQKPDVFRSDLSQSQFLHNTPADINVLAEVYNETLRNIFISIPLGIQSKCLTLLVHP